MNASKLFTSIAALVFAGSALAAEAPQATSAVSSAATVAAAAKSVSIAPSAATTREQVRAEAVEAAKHRRATEAGSADWFMK